MAFLTLAQFRIAAPEFAKVSDARVQWALDRAEARLDADVFGDLLEEAHQHLASHILTSNPQGREAALSKQQPESTIYSAQYDRLVALVGAGYGVLPDDVP